MTCGEASITFIAAEIGCFTVLTPEIAPASNEFPFINEASNSISPRAFKTAPFPALNKGESSII